MAKMFGNKKKNLPANFLKIRVRQRKELPWSKYIYVEKLQGRRVSTSCFHPVCRIIDV